MHSDLFNLLPVQRWSLSDRGEESLTLDSRRTLAVAQPPVRPPVYVNFTAKFTANFTAEAQKERTAGIDCTWELSS